MSELTGVKLIEAKRKLLDRQISYELNPPVDEHGRPWRFAASPLRFGETQSTSTSWRKPVSKTIEKGRPLLWSSYDPAHWATPTGEGKKAKPEKFNTIGVRFPESPGKEYTYKVRIGAKPYLGQELVADTPRGQAVVFVTRIDKTPQTAVPFGTTLKYIDRKAVAL